MTGKESLLEVRAQRISPTGWIRRLWGITAILALVALSVVTFDGPASAAIPPLGTYRVRNQYYTSECMVSRDAAGSRSAVTETACNTTFQDEWWTFYVDPVDHSYVHLKSYDKGSCLVARNSDPYAVLSACGHYSDQEWFVHFRSDGNFILQSKQSGLYLVPQSSGDWAHLVLRAVTGSRVEEWIQLPL